MIKRLTHGGFSARYEQLNPGFGGQSFLTETVAKIRELHQLIQKHHYEYMIEVDGGIEPETATKTSAPASLQIFAVSGSIPPSTSIIYS